MKKFDDSSKVLRTGLFESNENPYLVGMQDPVTLSKQELLKLLVQKDERLVDHAKELGDQAKQLADQVKQRFTSLWAEAFGADWPTTTGHGAS